MTGRRLKRTSSADGVKTSALELKVFATQLCPNQGAAAAPGAGFSGTIALAATGFGPVAATLGVSRLEHMFNICSEGLG